jgi:hypothetical protein
MNWQSIPFFHFLLNVCICFKIFVFPIKTGNIKRKKEERGPKRAGGVPQGVGPEFKPQYHKKKFGKRGVGEGFNFSNKVLGTAELLP